MATETRRERHEVSGSKLLETVKRLVHEGNVRRITIKGADDRTIFEVPLTIGVVGAVLLPVWVAIGAVAALAANFTIEVEKEDEPEPPAASAPADPPAPSSAIERRDPM